MEGGGICIQAAHSLGCAAPQAMPFALKNDSCSYSRAICLTAAYGHREVLDGCSKKSLGIYAAQINHDTNA